MRWVGFGGGIVMLAVMATSVLRVLLVPRATRSRLALLILTLVRWAFRTVARGPDQYRSKDRLLGACEPVGLLVLLATWVGMALVGYALILWPFELALSGLGSGFREAGSSMFTLGFVVPHHSASLAVDLLAAATGLVIVALQIGYLPTLYGAFNRREVQVTMLASRAGVPAWGPELLARHQLVGIMDDLHTLYHTWEEWAADVAESHTTYPSLLWFRSPRPLFSWVVGLLAVLDSAALYQALSPSAAPSQSRLCLRMGFVALREIAGVEGISYDPDPDPDSPLQLTYEDYSAGVARLVAAGFPMERSAKEAWPHFRGWRNNYESIAYALADRLMAPPAPWSGPRRRLPVSEVPPIRPRDRKPTVS
ncbi:MAG: hypothetical protein ACRDY2_06420 [Acidimicrobiales bacterium]